MKNKNIDISKDIVKNQDLKLEVIKNMETYGGSFVQSLSQCILKADSFNLTKLCNVFSDYIIQYYNIKN